MKLSGKRYCIEVKAGKGSGTSAIKVITDGKSDYLLYLKGDTKGGVDGKIITKPIYLLEQYQF